MAHFLSILVSAALLSAYAHLSAQWLHYPRHSANAGRKTERLRSGAENSGRKVGTFLESGRPDGNLKLFRDLGGGGAVIPCCHGRKALITSTWRTSRKAIRPSIALAME